MTAERSGGSSRRLVLAALARVGPTAQPVHGDGEGLVGLLGDRAAAHRAGVEPLDDLADRLDLVDGHRRPPEHFRAGEPEKAAQSHEPLGLVVDPGGVLLEDVVPALARRMLEPEDGVRVEQMRLAVTAPLVLTAHPEPSEPWAASVERVGHSVSGGDLRSDDIEPDPAELGETVPQK